MSFEDLTGEGGSKLAAQKGKFCHFA